MATTYTQLSANDAKKWIKNYSKKKHNPDYNEINQKFGLRVANHLQNTKLPNGNSFRTICLSFTDNQTGWDWMKLVIKNFDQTQLPMKGYSDGYRIYLGIKDDGTAIDILSVTKYVGGYLMDTDNYYEISPRAYYEDIVGSAERYETMKAMSLTPAIDEYSWHCEPHCPQ